MRNDGSIMTHANLVLGYLCDKTVLDYTPEGTIEKYFDGAIHYYHVRQALSFLQGSRYAHYARVGGAWKATELGRSFHAAGGYNTQLNNNV